MSQDSRLSRWAFYLAFGAAASILFSIAVSNILLALSFAVLLLSGEKLRLPPIRLPLSLFFLGTVISLAFSENPAAGRPQIRKFFVFLILLVISSSFRNVRQARWLVLTVGALATLSSLRALSQFLWMLQTCGGVYGCLVGERISGFMSHWMTFGGQMMMALLLVSSYLFWGRPPKRAALVLFGAAVICAALFAGGTRSIWLATALAGSWLLWRWKRWTVLIAPVAIVIALLAAPGFLRQRFTSAWNPQGDTDSNEHRRVSWRTGLRIIKAHPLLGLGPEHVKLKFREYVPPDVVRLPTGWYGHLHNIYLHYAAERGIPTLLALLWFLGKILVDFIRALRRVPAGSSDERFLLEGAIACVVAILIGGVFEHNLGDSEVLILFLSVVSCGYLAVESVDARPAPTPPHVEELEPSHT